jgi:hypothetical protein
MHYIGHDTCPGDQAKCPPKSVISERRAPEKAEEVLEAMCAHSGKAVMLISVESELDKDDGGVEDSGPSALLGKRRGLRLPGFESLCDSAVARQ